jgi:glucose/arabinose dehydrogenase
MLRRPLAMAGFAACALTAATFAQQPPAARPMPAVGSVEEVDVRGGKVRVVTVANGLFHPWSLAFLPDGNLLVAEKNGKLRLVRSPGTGTATLDAQPVWTAPPVKSGNGLHWIALHPQYAQNRLVYASYPKWGERGSTLAIARGRFDNNTLADVKEIFVADAWETGGNLAGKIMFGRDGMLYVTVGDRDRICCNAQQRRPDGSDDNSLRMKAQALDNHVGKTLRLRDDGTAPPDNPFVGRAGAKPEIFTYGHRNGYGLAHHPETGELWQVEIGPMGGDEANILIAGHNYGWPLVSMGRNYTGTLASDEPYFRKGMDSPRVFWVPSISPSSVMFYTGDKFPRWKNNLLVGSLNGFSIQRVAFGQPSQAEQREPLLRSMNLRFRDVVQGPDGFLYVATELGSGGNVADGTVLRIEPGT